ncbi:hypothetical protein HaLaN_19825 [Haematococcus lacustris]|uniref:Uncharacterized protein n=1 Tax=Haematococcus lacustris TaxID=44745 RepID=A0A699ZRN9_HAELA|nr:hypothetical protein HaLaN_19825 [Haematococcus lacustris]
MADGSVNIRKHDQRRSLAAGLGNQPLRRQHYKPRLTAANFSIFFWLMPQPVCSGTLSGAKVSEQLQVTTLCNPSDV